MTDLPISARPSLATRILGRAAAPLTLQAFIAALFISATLMFAIQPMFTRMVLPVLGGTPGVWSVAMVFFQGVLLCGYLYAHLLTRFVPMRTAALLHLVLMSLALLSLPIAIAKGWGTPPESGAAFWLIGLFAASLGLPFFALAGNGPLLQAWFARSGHRHAHDPYFLYGASNLGSFCGLLLYPVVFEPLMTLAQQSHVWTTGFMVLVGLIACASSLALRGNADAGLNAAQPLAKALVSAQRLKIIGLAFVPSALLVAVTAQLTTDVVAAPFIWVIPLALYLLTFALAFKDKPRLTHAMMLKVQPWLIGGAVVLATNAGAHDYIGGMASSMGIIVASFFVSTMVAHGELYASRPPAAQLTEFYLWMSFGGVLGGIFSALVAPHIFSTIMEYPILLVLALLCRPAFHKDPARNWLPEAAGLAAVAACLALPPLLGWFQISPDLAFARFLVIVVLAVVVMLSGSQPTRLLGLTAATLILALSWDPGFGHVLSLRSFFGVHRIIDSHDGKVRLLYHGTTIHGAQRLGAEAARQPPEMLTYYYEGGPFSQAIHAARSTRGALNDVAVVGLGSGSLACAAQKGEAWRFFEIDPVVVGIARDPQKFRFLSECAPNSDIVLGDARLTMAADQHSYDLIVLDAFSSDAIPVHLLTREAMAVYRSRLKPGGTIILHISNRHMRLDGVVARVAQEQGLMTWLGQDSSDVDFLGNFHAHAIIAVVASTPADVGDLKKLPNWVQLAPDPSIRAWSDDYANILQAIWLRIKG